MVEGMTEAVAQKCRRGDDGTGPSAVLVQSGMIVAVAATTVAVVVAVSAEAVAVSAEAVVVVEGGVVAEAVGVSISKACHTWALLLMIEDCEDNESHKGFVAFKRVC
jgi:hypothetical protein